MKSLTLTAFLATLAVTPAAAAPEWPQAEVDKVIEIVKARVHDYLIECVEGHGTKVRYETSQSDLNKDGVNEVFVRLSVAEYGKHATLCFGRSGTELHMASYDPATGWKHQFGGDMAEPIYHKSETDWPDVEMAGAGFCYPIERYHNGAYGLWKVCDGNTQIYAEDASWLEPGMFVPRSVKATPASLISGDQPRAPIHVDDMSGHEFMHNGSLMSVDSERGLIIYKEPKPSIADVVRPGDVLVEAEEGWDMYDINEKIVGTAFVFKKGCQPVGYRVSGGVGGSWHTVELYGEAPVRKKGSCDVVGMTKKGSNANLVFESVMD